MTLVYFRDTFFARFWNVNAVNILLGIWLKLQVVCSLKISKKKILIVYNLSIKGGICKSVEYTEDNLEQSVHSVYFYVLFSTYIVVRDTLIFNWHDQKNLALASLTNNFSHKHICWRFISTFIRQTPFFATCHIVCICCSCLIITLWKTLPHDI